MPVSTDDCKKFITEFLKVNNLVAPMFTERDGRMEVDLSSITIPGKWKRTRKCRPGGEGSMVSSGDSKYHRHYYVSELSGETRKVDKDEIAWERNFDHVDFEAQVQYLVLEDKNGNLHMGDYTGD